MQTRTRTFALLNGGSNWAIAASKVLLVQPSSAASERVFSLLKASFGEQQDSALQDYIEASRTIVVQTKFYFSQFHYNYLVLVSLTLFNFNNIIIKILHIT